MQLLAFPPGRQLRHEDGGADHLPGQGSERQEGLPDQPELLVRPPGGARRQGLPEAQAPGHPDRRRRPASAGAGQGLRALRGQDQGLRRRHRDHRQLGQRPRAADQGRQGRRPRHQLLHLLRRHHRRADRHGFGRRRARQVRGLLQPQQQGLPRRRHHRGLQEEVQRRLLRDGLVHRHCHAQQGDQGHQLDRPGQGGQGARRHQGRQHERHGRDAQHRPPGAAVAGGGHLDQGRRQGSQVRPGKHRLRLEDQRADGPVRVGPADLVPDEAAGLILRERAAALARWPRGLHTSGLSGRHSGLCLRP
ncbi:hypothetical protein CBM2629_A100172 [Cupriavidus taiwanensis]|nr:hypothetical protein CBM2629_A100172 [Cupriavidus taiwanensis]